MQTDVGGFFIHDGNSELQAHRIEKEVDDKKKKKSKPKKPKKPKDDVDHSKMDVSTEANVHAFSFTTDSAKKDHSPSKQEKLALDYDFPVALKTFFSNLHSKANSSKWIFTNLKSDIYLLIVLENDNKQNFTKIPPELDDDLLSIQRITCLQVEVKDRKNVYDELSKILGITSKSIRVNFFS